MARDLTKRKVRAVEAFADRAPAGRDCRVPAGFLEASGFQVVRDHPRYPLMRMDLRTALTWKDAREAAREALRVPAPAQPALRPVLLAAPSWAATGQHEPDPPGSGSLAWEMGQLMNSESSLTMLRFGMAPISRFFSTPPMNRARWGCS